VILAIQVQLPNSEVLASCSADFTCCVIKSLSPPLSVVQLFTNLKHTGQILFKLAIFHSFVLSTRGDHKHTSKLWFNSIGNLAFSM